MFLSSARRPARAAAVALAAFGLILPAAVVAPAAHAAARQAAAPEILDTTFPSGLRVKVPVPKGMDSGSYDSMLQDTYNRIITANGAVGRYITPSDVVVLCPPPLPQKAAAPAKGKAAPKTAAQALQQLTGPVDAKTLDPNGTYVIYVMGRKFVTVDQNSAKAMGFADAKTCAFKIARDCQQSFPRVCFRPPSLPDYNPPANPPLTLTANIARVVPQDVVSRVELWGTPLLTVAGPQLDGTTPPDRVHLLSLKVSKVIGRRGAHTPEEVVTKVLPAANPKLAEQAQVMVGTDVLFTLTAADAKANKLPKAGALADKVAMAIKTRLAESADTAAPASNPGAAAAPAPAATTPVPTTPAPVPADPPAPAPDPAPSDPNPAPATNP